MQDPPLQHKVSTYCLLYIYTVYNGTYQKHPGRRPLKALSDSDQNACSNDTSYALTLNCFDKDHSNWSYSKAPWKHHRHLNLEWPEQSRN